MTQQKKSPGGVAAPSEAVTHSPEKEMNDMTDTTSRTAIPQFPLFAANQAPQDDLAHVTGTLRVISFVLEEGCQRGINASTASDLLALLCTALDELRPIQMLLDDLDGTVPAYRDCRRLDIIQRNARAVA